MINKLNKLIIELCKKIEEYEEYYEIDEYLNKYEEDEFKYVLYAKEAYLKQKNGNKIKKYEDAISLYFDIEETREYDDDYYVVEKVTVYDQLETLNEPVLDFIQEQSDDDQLEIITYICNHFINCYNDIDGEIELNLINTIKDFVQDETNFDEFYNNTDINEIVLCDYCHEIFELYQDNKTFMQDDKINTINKVVRQNIINIIDDAIDKYEYKDIYKIILLSLINNKNDDKNIKDLKNYTILTLIHDYYKLCSMNRKQNENNTYYKYIKNEDVTIKDLYVLFNNDNEFSKEVINSFINSYLYIDCNMSTNNLEEDDKKVLSKKFFSIRLLDCL